MPTVRIQIKGRIQGVFFRQSTKAKAESLKIKGTVKNLRDETVEIIATADAATLQELIAWCRQGPPKARVTNVEVTEMEPHHFKDFSIIR